MPFAISGLCLDCYEREKEVARVGKRHGGTSVLAEEVRDTQGLCPNVCMACVPEVGPKEAKTEANYLSIYGPGLWRIMSDKERGLSVLRRYPLADHYELWCTACERFQSEEHLRSEKHRRRLSWM